MEDIEQPAGLGGGEKGRNRSLNEHLFGASRVGFGSFPPSLAV